MYFNIATCVLFKSQKPKRTVLLVLSVSNEHNHLYSVFQQGYRKYATFSVLSGILFLNIQICYLNFFYCVNNNILIKQIITFNKSPAPKDWKTEVREFS